MSRKSRIDAPGVLHHIIARGIERKAVFQDHRDRDDFLERLVIAARSLVCFWAVRELGITQTRLARLLRISQPAVSAAVNRGEQLAKDHKFSMDE